MVQGLLQHWDAYTDDHHNTWKRLYERQVANLEGKASPLYLRSLAAMQGALTRDDVPRISAMEALLQRTTGWSLTVVPGLIPVEDFFQLLAQKRFCTSTWVRRPDQLDYIEEPDMFHDTFGHIPPLMDADFAAFMHRFGEVGAALVAAGEEEAVLGLQRLYWYFVEFGFLRGATGEPELLGAGIMSSFGETNHAWSLKHALKPMVLEDVMNTPFRTDVIQTDYFLVDDVVTLSTTWTSGLRRSILKHSHEKRNPRSVGDGLLLGGMGAMRRAAVPLPGVR